MAGGGKGEKNVYCPSQLDEYITTEVRLQGYNVQVTLGCAKVVCYG